jgi:hypothetical protein
VCFIAVQVKWNARSLAKLGERSGGRGHLRPARCGAAQAGQADVEAHLADFLLVALSLALMALLATGCSNGTNASFARMISLSSQADGAACERTERKSATLEGEIRCEPEHFFCNFIRRPVGCCPLLAAGQIPSGRSQSNLPSETQDGR